MTANNSDSKSTVNNNSINNNNNSISNKKADQIDAAVHMWTYLCRACYELPSLSSVVKDDMQNVLTFLLSSTLEKK